MVPLTDRLCTPEQAIYFQSQGLIQTSCYAWERVAGGKYDFVVDLGKDNLPQVVDWSEDPGCFAAFDNTDLGLLLASIDYFPAGPAYPDFHTPGHAQAWWCDEISTLFNVSNALNQGYGRTEAEAKGRMLEKLLREGKVPSDWRYFAINAAAREAALENDENPLTVL